MIRYRNFQYFNTIFLILFFITQAITPDFDVFKNTYSDYALGEYGIVVSGSIVLIGVNQTAISYVLLRKSYVLSALLLATAGIGGLLAGIFPTSNDSLTNLLHTIGSGTEFIATPLALITLSFVAQNKMKVLLQLFGFSTAAIFAGYISLWVLHIDTPYFGLIEKVGIVSLIAGIVTIVAFLANATHASSSSVN